MNEEEQKERKSRKRNSRKKRGDQKLVQAYIQKVFISVIEYDASLKNPWPNQEGH